MVLEAMLFVDVPLQDGWTQVLVSGKDYEVRVLFEQCQEPSMGGVQIVLALALLLVELDLGLQFRLKGCHGSL